MNGFRQSGNYPVALYRRVNGKKIEIKGKTRRLRGVGIHCEDYGVIIRSPHPRFPDRLVIICAGAHSLGTGAACLAATRSSLIRQIKEALPAGVDISDKERAIWILVRGVLSGTEGVLSENDVKIVEAGVY
jgi:hypothetical protein